MSAAIYKNAALQDQLTFDGSSTGWKQQTATGLTTTGTAGQYVQSRSRLLGGSMTWDEVIHNVWIVIEEGDLV
jgi:hypothetical protein